MLLRQDRYRAYTPPYLLYGLLGVSLFMNLYMVMTRPSASEDPEAVVAAMSPPVDEGEPTLQARVAEVETVSVSAAGGAGEWQLLRGEVTRSLGHTFSSQLERGSEAMTMPGQPTAWTALQGHASFPEAMTEITPCRHQTQAGTFDAWTYVVTAPDGTVTTFVFARDLAGPPIDMSTWQGGMLVSRMELVDYGPR